MPNVPVPLPSQTPAKDRTLRFKRSLRNIRGSSGGALKEKDGNSRPSTATSAGQSSGRNSGEEANSPEKATPAFDVEQMKAKRLQWEARSRQGSVEFVEAN